MTGAAWFRAGFRSSCAEAGAEVVMADILSDLVQQEAQALQQQGLNVHAVTVDLANADSIENAVAKAWKYYKD